MVWYEKAMRRRSSRKYRPTLRATVVYARARSRSFAVSRDTNERNDGKCWTMKLDIAASIIFSAESLNARNRS